MKIFSALIILAVLSIGGGIFVLLAYGVGMLVNHVLGFTAFEATILSFAGMSVIIFTVTRLMTSASPFPPFMDFPGAEYDMDEYDDEEEEEVEVVSSGKSAPSYQPRHTAKPHRRHR